MNLTVVTCFLLWIDSDSEMIEKLQFVFRFDLRLSSVFDI
jgi:hypothetical protein